MMKERPLSFTTDMVRALLDGSKIVTRRTVRTRKGADFPKNPYGKPGDVLWVKEQLVKDTYEQHGLVLTGAVYKADGAKVFGSFLELRGKLHHPIRITWSWACEHLGVRFCPRHCARIFLEVVDVHMEPLQDITDEDARLEGVEDREAFKVLWDKLNKPRGKPWASNPMVFRVQFRLKERG